MPYEESYRAAASQEDYAKVKAENFSLNLRVEQLLAMIDKLEAKMATMSQNVDDLPAEPEEPPVRGADILLDAYALITGPRQAAYAHPIEDYAKVTDIFHALTGIRLSLEQGILFMVSIKLARLRTNMEGGRTHWDSLVDAAGYLGCLGMVWAADGDPWEPYYDKEPGNE